MLEHTLDSTAPKGADKEAQMGTVNSKPSNRGTKWNRHSRQAMRVENALIALFREGKDVEEAEGSLKAPVVRQNERPHREAFKTTSEPYRNWLTPEEIKAKNEASAQGVEVMVIRRTK